MASESGIDYENPKKYLKPDRCFNCLRVFGLCFTVLLLLASTTLLVLGFLLISDFIFDWIREEMWQKILPHLQNNSTLLTGRRFDLQAGKSFLQMVGVVVVACGLFLVLFCSLGFAMFCCCTKKKKFLTVCLVLVILLFCGQIIVIIMMADARIFYDLLKRILFGFLIDYHDDDDALSLAIQTGLNCCSVFGAKDFFCRDIYDVNCNAGCRNQSLGMHFCPLDLRDPIRAADDPICVSILGGDDVNVASSDFRFKQIGNQSFDEAAARRPGCLGEIWFRMKPVLLGSICLAVYLLFVEAIYLFFLWYCLARLRGDSNVSLIRDKGVQADGLIPTYIIKNSKNRNASSDSSSSYEYEYEYDSPRPPPVIQKKGKRSVSSSSSSTSSSSPDGPGRIMVDDGTWQEDGSGRWTLKELPPEPAPPLKTLSPKTQQRPQVGWQQMGKKRKQLQQQQRRQQQQQQRRRSNVKRVSFSSKT